MDLVIINQPQVYPYRRVHQFAKRLLDIVLCVIALPFLLPLMAVCVVLIRADSAGPALFVQERIGKGGRPFRMYKFRTMQHNLDNSAHRAFMKAFVNGEIGDEGNTAADALPHAMGGNEHAASHRAFLHAFAGSDANHAGTEKIYKPVQDSQITRVGRILRKTSLDELPQILNILKGEMSLVGPRPNVPWEVEEYQPWHYERLEVLPGLTGLAQVRGRSGISFNHIVQYDIEYIEKQCLALDVQILWATFASVARGVGAK
ncbi:MAG: sugar transferase [Anaerolineales bacterium]|nr:sugar transferase [Anaerolineales bacterium]